ncbi:MAG: hypothetical protein M0036_15900 [Desulfobacteraceae bacterium]|nr:hypothetical protein [Desulfobacteraceae bacterium]
MPKILAAVLYLLVSVSTLHADDYAPFKYKLKVFVEGADFYWDEHYNGEKLLQEDGIIWGTGFTFQYLTRKSNTSEDDPYRLTYGGTLRLNFGKVDYDGQTQDGTPAQTKVNYFGATVEGHLGWLCKTSKEWLFVEPNINLGFSPWSRDIQSNDFATGYTENWIDLYSKAGLAFAFPFKPDFMLNLSGGAIVPLWVRNTVDLGGTITLEPKAFIPSPYVDATFEYKRFGLCFFYESFQFGESDRVYVGNYYYLQPDSYTYRWGLRLTFAIF